MKQLVKPYDGKRPVRFDVEGSGEIQTFTLLSREFRKSMKLLGIRSEYIQKHTPEDNGDIESFHNSLKTDYIWVNDLETFEDAKKLMESAFDDYNSVRLHSSIDYLPPDEFERRLREEDGFRDRFLEGRKRKEEKRLKNKIEKKEAEVTLD